MPKQAKTDLFRRDWFDGLMISEICQRHTLSRDQVVRLRVRLELPARMDRGRRRKAKENETPTQEEISFRAAEIRKNWPPEVERKRRVYQEPEFYEIPQNVEAPEDFDPSWYD
jgi:hypothetical protein